MATYSDKKGILNAVLSVLIVGLDLVLVLIGLGFVIGIYELLK